MSKPPPRSSRLFAELLAIIATTDVVVMSLLAPVAPSVHGFPEAMLHALMLLIMAGPLFFWRMQAAGKNATHDGSGEIAASAISRAGSMTRDVHEVALHSERLAEIARRTSNGAVVTDAQGRIEWINEGFSRICG